MLTSKPKGFAFIHVPKTGGQWVARCLEQAAPASWGLEKIGRPHAPAKDAAHGLRLFAFVRNPWSWYVSLHSFYRQHFFDKTGGYILPRKQWRTAEEHYARMFEDSPRDPIDCFRKNFDDIVSVEARYRTLSEAFSEIVESSANAVMVGKMETMRSDSVSLLEFATGGKIPEELKRKLNSLKPVNTSRHANYREYYTKRMVDKVAKRDKVLIEKFNYSF